MFEGDAPVESVGVGVFEGVKVAEGVAEGEGAMQLLMTILPPRPFAPAALVCVKRAVALNVARDRFTYELPPPPPP